eukprot:scaffold152575_cov32-Prasinocladus_malaysianus.AAC.1
MPRGHLHAAWEDAGQQHRPERGKPNQLNEMPSSFDMRIYPLNINETFRVLLGKHGMGDDQLQTLVDYGLGRNAALPITSLDLRCNKLSPMAGPCIKQLLQFTATIQ